MEINDGRLCKQYKRERDWQKEDVIFLVTIKLDAGGVIFATDKRMSYYIINILKMWSS